MSNIDKNQPNWFGNSGEPLKSGYIYIGQANQTPVENPKTVTFTDSSGNAFTATQPLRTNSDGQIVWNGKAITATVEGDYSILMLDSTQTQINGGYVPFVEGDSEWELKQIGKFNNSNPLFLAIAGLDLNNMDYLRLYSQLSNYNDEDFQNYSFDPIQLILDLTVKNKL